MKKLLIAILSSAFVLAGCRTDTTNQQNQNSEKQEVGYKVISEDVPQFDMIPISYTEKGYIAKEDGKFGYIDLEGNWVVEPTYEAISFFPEEAFGGKSDQTNSEGISKIGVCLLNSLEDNEGDRLEFFLTGEGDRTRIVSGIGGTGGGQYVVKNGDSVVWEASENAPEPTYESDNLIILFNKTYYQSKGDDYYLYSLNSKTLYGPFNKDNPATFEMIDSTDGIDIRHYFIHDNDQITGLFMVKEKDGYVIYDPTGTKKSEAYDDAKIISSFTILAKKGDQWGIVDENLDFIDLKDTSIEEMSKPIDGKCFIKKDGKWILVEIKGSKKEKKEEQQEEAQTISYVVLDDVVNGVYLHTEPDKEDKSNRRGLLMPKETVEIVDIIENEDCVWGKTKDNQYVCIYETATDEDKPVGEYMKPADQVQSSSNIDTSSYSSLIEDYRMALDHKDVSYLQKYGIHSLEGYPSLENTIEFPHSSAWFHGYLIKDINGDGIEEFIVGYNPKARLAGMYFNSFEALYTMKDGNIVYLCGRDDLNGSEFHILYDGTLYKYKPSTTPTVDVEHYKIQEDSMVLLDSFQGEAGALRGDYYDDSVDNGWVDNLTLFENN